MMEQTNMFTTQSEDEALDLLAERRARLIATGYDVAVSLARRDGAVTSQAVIAEMDRRGLFRDGDLDVAQNWTALIFKGKDHKDTWKPVCHIKVGNKQRNVHAAPRMLWRLADAPVPATYRGKALPRQVGSMAMAARMVRNEASAADVIRGAYDAIKEYPPNVVLARRLLREYLEDTEGRS